MSDRELLELAAIIGVVAVLFWVGYGLNVLWRSMT